MILFLPAFLGACSAPSSSAVYLRGEINTAKVAAALDLLRRNPDRLDITSSGGDPVAAMALGRGLRALDTKVTVRGYCLSSCATYVLASAREIQIEPGALVGFHHTDTAIFDVLGSHLANPAPLKARAEAELTFVRDMGAPPDLLRVPFIAMRPTCYEIFQPQAGATYNGAVRTQKTLYVPNAVRLRQLGLRVNGSNVASDAEFAAWRSRFGRPDAPSTPVFDSAMSEPERFDLATVLASTPPCREPLP